MSADEATAALDAVDCVNALPLSLRGGLKSAAIAASIARTTGTSLTEIHSLEIM